MIGKYWVVDVTELDNGLNLKKQIIDSNCRIIEYREVL